MNNQHSVSKISDLESKPVSALNSVEVNGGGSALQSNRGAGAQSQTAGNLEKTEQVQARNKHNAQYVNALSPFQENKEKDVVSDYDQIIKSIDKEIGQNDLSNNQVEMSRYKTTNKDNKAVKFTEDGNGTDDEDIQNSK